MELEGLKRGMTFLERLVKVKDLVTDLHSMVKKYTRENNKDLVTDRHSMVKKYMRENNKDLVTDLHSMVKKYMRENNKDKNHYFDVWHVAKGMIISLLLL